MKLAATLSVCLVNLGLFLNFIVYGKSYDNFYFLLSFNNKIIVCTLILMIIFVERKRDSVLEIGIIIGEENIWVLGNY